MGINTNVIYQTNIILNAVYITYSVLSQFPLPNFHPVPLARNLTRIPKLRHFLMRGQQSVLCKLHILNTSYHSKSEWVPYQRKLSHKSTGTFLTINQYFSQQSDGPSNRPAVHHSHPVCKIMTRKYCSVFLCCKN